MAPDTTCIKGTNFNTMTMLPIFLQNILQLPFNFQLHDNQPSRRCPMNPQSIHPACKKWVNEGVRCSVWWWLLSHLFPSPRIKLVTDLLSCGHVTCATDTSPMILQRILGLNLLFEKWGSQILVLTSKTWSYHKGAPLYAFGCTKKVF